jgi:arylsulfatase A
VGDNEITLGSIMKDAGYTTAQIGAFWDVLPTLADIVNSDIPEDIDGISFLPVLQCRDNQQKKHEYLYWELNAVGENQKVQTEAHLVY